MIDVSELPCREETRQDRSGRRYTTLKCGIVVKVEEVLTSPTFSTPREFLEARLRASVWREIYGDLEPLLCEARAVALNHCPLPELHRLEDLFDALEALLKKPPDPSRG